MKIGIDINPLIHSLAIKTGTEYYMHNLIRNLTNVDKHNQYSLCGYIWRDYHFWIKKVNFDLPLNFSLRIKRIPTKLIRFLYNQNIPFEFLFGKIDIFHIFRPDVFYKFRGSKKIITIFDLTFELFPQYHTKENLLRCKKIYHLAQDADRIITISENTKRDLNRLYKIPLEKIKVTYLAASEIYCPVKNFNLFNRIMREYNLPYKFILFVGTIEPRKNLIRLINAYHLLKKKKELEQKLVIVGKKGWLYDEVFQTIEDLNLSNDVIFTGYIPEEELVFIYNAADLFIYPSLYEGFGLPPLEAMACGVPVITSNVSSLPEVVGDAAVLVDPYNIEEMAEAIEKVLSIQELRDILSNKGLERAKLFSWEKTARETIKVYQELGGKI